MTTRVRTLLAVLMLWIYPTCADATVLFISGFEMGYPTINSSPGSDAFFLQGCTQFDTTTIPVNLVRSGAWSMRNQCSVALAARMVTGLSTPTIACRFYFVPTSASGTTGTGLGMIFYMVGGTSVFKIGLDSSQHIVLQTDGGFTTATGTTTIPADVFTRIDAIYDQGAGGVGNIYVNGTLELTATHPGAQGNVTEVRMAGSAAPRQWAVDDMLCQDGTALPPAGSVLVRQGTAGLPIDTDWTLSGCSGAIETCWSHTPYTASPNATTGSTTDIRAQSMLVWPFSSTQPGHGNQAILPGSIINAVQIAVTAKTSSTASGGDSLSIRRYVNGSLIATYPLTIITGDQSYKSPIFTDTIANLDLYQMGVVKPMTGAALSQTASDMWLLVDVNLTPGMIHHRVDVPQR